MDHPIEALMPPPAAMEVGRWVTDHADHLVIEWRPIVAIHVPPQDPDYEFRQVTVIDLFGKEYDPAESAPGMTDPEKDQFVLRYLSNGEWIQP